jgi:hypothetical protein
MINIFGTHYNSADLDTIDLESPLIPDNGKVSTPQKSYTPSLLTIAKVAFLSLGSVALFLTLNESNISSNETQTSLEVQTPSKVTSAETLDEIKIVNDITDTYLQLTSSSSWNGGLNCLNSSCSTSLKYSEYQVIEMTEDVSTSSGMQTGYNVCGDSGNSCSTYLSHIQINYADKDNMINPTLSNDGEGTIELVDGHDGSYYLRKVLSPTPAPVTSPPTNPPVPTLRPTSAPPTTNKPSAIPTTSRPTVSLSPTYSPGGHIENSVWYIDWTTWFTSTPYLIPEGVNLINIFVGKIIESEDGTYTLGGFGNMNLDQMDEFVAECREKGIDVKVSIGGGGGSYDKTWEIINSDNTKEVAQGLVDFCHAHNLSGVDFDDEDVGSSDLNKLVGGVISEFKKIDPNLEATLCTNAGFDTWKGAVGTILDAAVVTPGKCPIDRLYVMSYYDPIESEKEWLTSWANWLQTTYNCPYSVTTAGVDDFDAHAYNTTELANWAHSMGYSVAHWACDPANPESCKQP